MINTHWIHYSQNHVYVTCGETVNADEFSIYIIDNIKFNNN